MPTNKYLDASYSVVVHKRPSYVGVFVESLVLVILIRLEKKILGYHLYR